jgi:ABC-2 type transport system permease protein
MAVYKRTYKSYTGMLTPEWSRLLVIPRYAWASLFQQRFLTILYVLCFFYPLGAALVIYLNSNLDFLRQYIPIKQGGLLQIDGLFFFTFTGVQATLAFILTAFIGPGLMSPDLMHNALPLYFCRPLTRAQYIAGKMLVLTGLLSAITWVPGLLLFLLQASLAPAEWFKTNYWIAGSIVGGFLLWILLISLLALALSAWVRWKVIAGALMLVVLFVGAGLAQMIKEVMRSDWGQYLDIVSNMTRVWMQMYGVQADHPLSLEESIMALAAFSALFLFLISQKVKPFEVVRG